MIVLDTNAIRGAIASRGYSQRSFAREIKMPEQTFYKKMKRGIFGSDELENIFDALEVEDVRIFFTQKDT